MELSKELHNSKAVAYLLKNDLVTICSLKNEFEKRFYEERKKVLELYQKSCIELEGPDNERGYPVYLFYRFSLKIITEEIKLSPFTVSKCELARFYRIESKEVVLSIYERNSILLNPNLLYDIGTKFGKEL